MPKTFIHLGYPKCASTYLQDEIFPQLGNYSHIVRAPNEEKYYPFNRTFSPDTFQAYVEKHIQNPRAERDHLLISFEDWCELLFQEFEDALSTYRHLSREKYEFSNLRVLGNLNQAYPDAHIIIIIRRQVSWINSRYKMLYRGAKTFMPIDQILEHPLNGYDQLIEVAQELFGKEKVTVIPFELIRTDKKAFIESVTQLVNPEQPIEVSDKAVNIAPVLQRKVNYSRTLLRIRRALENRHIRILYGLVKLLLILTLKPYLWLRYRDKPCADPCAEISEKLSKQFEASNRAVEKMTGLDLKSFGYL
jgi:hypothetical protein